MVRRPISTLKLVKAVRALPCELYWQPQVQQHWQTVLIASPSPLTLSSIPNSVIDTNSTDCVGYAATYSYDYGYIEDYDGAGNAGIVSRNTGTTTWTEWYTEGDLYGGTAATIDLTGNQFTYSIGYADYAYQGYYFTNTILGSATVQ